MENRNKFIHEIIDDIEFMMGHTNFRCGEVHSDIMLLTIISNVLMCKLPGDEDRPETFIKDLVIDILDEYITLTDSDIIFRYDLIRARNLVI